MNLGAKNVADYLEKVPDDRKPYFNKLRQTILENLPDGFEEDFQYGMIGYVVPHSKYPDGYHCDPQVPLPFASIASQKNFIALYHSGIYANQDLLNWFGSEYPKYSQTKLDMGKSCIRFKKVDQIPYDLIGELMRQLSADQWIEIYETSIKR